jgi:antitoxin (DNA-binding transcriptional repressor) of toxin-antitoxin stability system
MGSHSGAADHFLTLDKGSHLVRQIGETMKKVTVRQIRNQFPTVLCLIQNGETVAITLRRTVVATLSPPPKKAPAKRAWADIDARLARLMAQPMMEISGVELVSEGRGDV